MKHVFEIGKDYEVFNETEGCSWNNNLRCTSRTENTAIFDEINEHDEVVKSFKVELKEKFFSVHDSTEYATIENDCIIQAF